MWTFTLFPVYLNLWFSINKQSNKTNVSLIFGHPSLSFPVRLVGVRRGCRHGYWFGDGVIVGLVAQLSKERLQEHDNLFGELWQKSFCAAQRLQVSNSMHRAAYKNL